MGAVLAFSQRVRAKSSSRTRGEVPRVRGIGLSHMVVREGAIEASGRFGKLVCRQTEFTGGCGDHLRRDVAAAALAAHVVERVADGIHVEGFRGEVLLVLFFHGMSVC